MPLIPASDSGMKKSSLKIIFLLLFSLCLPLTSAIADRLGVFATRYNPKDLDATNGYGAMARAPLMPLLDFDLSISRIEFDEINLTPIEVAFLVPIPFPLIDPYVGVGGGYYRITGSNPNDLSSDWSYFPVGGAGFSLGPLGIFAEARYRMLEPGGADFRGLTINLGLNFSY